MKRRNFIKVVSLGAAGAALGWYWPDEGVFNPCHAQTTPQALLDHDLLAQAWEGINPQHFWDTHTHLIGTGDSDSGIYLHPAMQDVLSPAQYVRYHFYINASCSDTGQGVDHGFIARLRQLLDEFPAGARSMLLAFDYHHADDGKRDTERTPFHTPNAYAMRVARSFPQRFEWVASIHPYREDCVEQLDKAVAQGARGVKWLPPVMGINPASAKCDRFYAAMARHRLPLLTHAGDEHAVDGVEAQAMGNPLLLRRALEHGVTVVVAHCASEGMGIDLDKGANGPPVSNFDLFARLMDDKRYEGNLFGEISAMTQLNRVGPALQTVLSRDEWQHRLVNGSDYPLPGVMPLFSVKQMAERGYLDAQHVPYISELRRYNPLLFDFVLKRNLRWQGKRFAPLVFDSRRVFDNTLNNNKG